MHSLFFNGVMPLSCSACNAFINNNVRPFAVLHIFDALVKSIALYECEVWIGFKSCYQTKAIEEMFEITFKG